MGLTANGRKPFTLFPSFWMRSRRRNVRIYFCSNPTTRISPPRPSTRTVSTSATSPLQPLQGQGCWSPVRELIFDLWFSQNPIDLWSLTSQATRSPDVSPLSTCTREWWASWEWRLANIFQLSLQFLIQCQSDICHVCFRRVVKRNTSSWIWLDRDLCL